MAGKRSRDDFEGDSWTENDETHVQPAGEGGSRNVDSRVHLPSEDQIKVARGGCDIGVADAVEGAGDALGSGDGPAIGEDKDEEVDDEEDEEEDSESDDDDMKQAFRQARAELNEKKPGLRYRENENIWRCYWCKGHTKIRNWTNLRQLLDHADGRARGASRSADHRGKHRALVQYIRFEPKLAEERGWARIV